MKSRENFVQGLVGIAAFVVLAMLVLLATEDADGSGRTGTPGSAHSEGPVGARVLRVALESSGHDVRILVDGDLAPSGTVVMLLEPAVRPGELEMRDLVHAVRIGGATLVAAGSHEQLSLLPEDLLPPELPPTRRTLGPDVMRITVPMPFSPEVAGVLEPGPDAMDPRRLLPLRCFTGPVPGMEPLAMAARSRLPVLVGGPAGAGNVILCSEPRVFENRWLHQLQNVELAAALTSAQPTVAFDERWRLGDRAPSPMTALLYGTGPGRASILIVLGGLLALYLAGLYPGGAPLSGLPRRRPMHYVDSMAHLVLSADAPATMITHFQAGLRRRACRRLGLQPDAPVHTIAGLIADRTAADERMVFRVLSDVPPPEQLPRWVALMDSWEKRL